MPRQYCAVFSCQKEFKGKSYPISEKFVHFFNLIQSSKEKRICKTCYNKFNTDCFHINKDESDGLYEETEAEIQTSKTTPVPNLVLFQPSQIVNFINERTVCDTCNGKVTCSDIKSNGMDCDFEIFCPTCQQKKTHSLTMEKLTI
jgi:hypothetical protein